MNNFDCVVVCLDGEIDSSIDTKDCDAAENEISTNVPGRDAETSIRSDPIVVEEEVIDDTPTDDSNNQVEGVKSSINVDENGVDTKNIVPNVTADTVAPSENEGCESRENDKMVPTDSETNSSVNDFDNLANVSNNGEFNAVQHCWRLQ